MPVLPYASLYRLGRDDLNTKGPTADQEPTRRNLVLANDEYAGCPIRVVRERRRVTICALMPGGVCCGLEAVSTETVSDRLLSPPRSGHRVSLLAARIAICVLSVALLRVSPVQGQRETGDVALPDTARYVASTRGRVYYPVACRGWRRLSTDNLIYFRTEEAATAAGYERTRSYECADSGALGPVADVMGWLQRMGDARIDRSRVAGVCVVARIVDGDTADCQDGVRVRLLLVDAPELGQSDLGLRAKLALEELIPPGDSVLVVLDVQRRDRYKRLLGHLYRLDGTWVNRALVRRGHAVPLVLPPNVRQVDAIRAAADSARVEGRGLWGRSGGLDAVSPSSELKTSAGSRCAAFTMGS